MLVRVLDVDDRQMAEIAIVENLQRRDLDALEKAASFRQYLTAWQCTQEELAKRLSIDRSTVANLIRLLELPEAVQQKLRSGMISMGHARALLPLGDEHEQTRLTDRIVAEGLSVRTIDNEFVSLLYPWPLPMNTLIYHVSEPTFCDLELFSNLHLEFQLHTYRHYDQI